MSGQIAKITSGIDYVAIDAGDDRYVYVFTSSTPAIATIGSLLSEDNSSVFTIDAAALCMVKLVMICHELIHSVVHEDGDAKHIVGGASVE